MAKPTKEKEAKKTKDQKSSDNSKTSYTSLTITCACGATFESGSTRDKIHVDICSQCHPFFTGEKKIVDTEGRVEKFRKKYNLA